MTKKSNWKEQAEKRQKALKPLSSNDVDRIKRELPVIARLQELEGNPFDTTDFTMFEMFARERWSPERCIEYIRSEAVASTAK